MVKRLIFIGIWFYGIALYSMGQEAVVQQTVEDLLESTGDNMGDDSDIQELLDDLEYLRENPLIINLATVDEIHRLHVLSQLQIESLIRYREKTGVIYSIYELATIDGFTPDILEKIEPFISFGLQEGKQKWKKSSSDLFLRSTRTVPFSDQTKYEGSPVRFYLRLKHVSSTIEFGLVSEKDPGEAFLSKSNKFGFDYTSAYANFGVGNRGNRIFAGDFHVRFGQGLVLWQGFSMGKSSETTQVFCSNQGVRSYSSTDENQFFRGLAGQFKCKRITFLPFISFRKLDANIDTLDGKPYFGAFQISGYHRTASEMTGENALGQFSGGSHIDYSYGSWTLGFTGVYTRFNVSMDRSDEPYNQFLPEGNESMVAGFDWKGSVRKVFLFGEAGISANSGRALVAGMTMKPASNAEISLVYRNINQTFFSYYSNSFTESSRTNDEHALYTGIKVFPAPRFVFQAYADFFRFKWIKYTTSAPSAGTEFFTQLEYFPRRNTSFYLRFFQEDKGQRVITENLKYDERQLIKRIRLNYLHVLNEQLSFKGRLEFSFYSKNEKEKGFLIYQDIVYKPMKKPFGLNGRLAYFETDGYNSRLYAYENDLLYTFSIPALYGKGIRSYLNLVYKFGNEFTLWLKMASTYQFVQKGIETTSVSSLKSDIKIQVRYQF